MKRSVRALVLVCGGLTAAIAQKTTPPVMAPTPGTVSNPGSLPGSIGSPSTTQPGNVGVPTPGDSMPVFIYGKVAMADGSPVPFSITIERVCFGTARPAAYTDRKGNFNFQWGDSFGLMPDASEASNQMQRTPMPGAFSRSPVASQVQSTSGCELHADVPGYTSEAVSLDNFQGAGNSDVGTIVLHRMGNVEGQSVSATAYKAPPDARKDYDKGLQAFHKGKLADAEKDFARAVAIYPQYANAWLDLGKARLQNKAPDAAQQAFLKALDADPKLVEAHVELGILAAGRSQWPDAAKYLDSALRLDPVDFPRIWFIDAVANFNIRNIDVAEKNVREAMKLDPRHRNPETDRLLGAILAVRRDYSGAATELNTYLKLAPGAPDTAQVKTQLSEIEKARAAAQP